MLCAQTARLGTMEGEAQPTATEVAEPLRVLPFALLAARNQIWRAYRPSDSSRCRPPGSLWQCSCTVLLPALYVNVDGFSSARTCPCDAPQCITEQRLCSCSLVAHPCKHVPLLVHLAGCRAHMAT